MNITVVNKLSRSLTMTGYLRNGNKTSDSPLTVSAGGSGTYKLNDIGTDYFTVSVTSPSTVQWYTSLTPSGTVYNLGSDPKIQDTAGSWFTKITFEPVQTYGDYADYSDYSDYSNLVYGDYSDYDDYSNYDDYNDYDDYSDVTDWGRGYNIGTYRDSASGTDEILREDVNWLIFIPPYDGDLDVEIQELNGNDDVVLFYVEGVTSFSFDDDQNPDYLVVWDAKSDSTGEGGAEDLSISVSAGVSYLIGWYEYTGSRADIEWSLDYYPAETRWRCYDLEAQAYIAPYNTYTYTTASSITRPSDLLSQGYIYVGYVAAGTITTCINEGLAGNFSGTGITCTYHNHGTRDNVAFFYRKPTIASWQTPQSLTSISGTTYTSYGPTTSTINAYNAGYVTYTTPSYRGKLVCKTTSSSASVDHYTHLSATTLSAGSGTARNAAVTGSILASDDNGAGGYNSQISYICTPSTAYQWYINAAWANTGTITATWQLNYYREYTITYNVNGGSGSIASQAFYTDNLSVPLTTQVPSRTNYIFKGWAETSSATTPKYTVGQTASLAATNITLYAVWELALATYTVTYNANGGSGAPNPLNALQNSNVTIDTSTIPTRANYVFKGWATSSTAKTPLYKKGSVGIINMQSNVTLYAVWWPDFNWNEKNAAEGQTFNNLITTYINATNNSTITTGNIYDVLWFNNIAAKLRHPSKVGGDLITDADLNSLVNYYREY